MNVLALRLRLRTGRSGLLANGAAFADQVLFAFGMFALNVLLARWLEPAAYGAFALAFVVFLLLGNFHTAVLTEPMLIHGSGKYRRQLPAYFGRLLLGHAALSLTIAAALGVAAVVASAAGSETLAGAFAGLAFAAPGLLLLWLARRVFYVTGEHLRAVAGDLLFLAVMLGGLAALHEWSDVTAGLGFAVAGVAGLVAGLALVAVVRPSFRAVDPPPRSVLRDHWEYGRWSVTAQALLWTSGQIVLVLVPLVLGLHEAGVVAAVLNLFRPLHPIQQSAIAVLLPGASALAAAGAGRAAIARYIRRALLPLTAAIVLYGAVLAVLAEQVMRHLYLGRYGDERLLIVLVAAVYALATTVQAQTVLLKATGNVKSVPLVFAASAAVTLAFSVPAMLVANAEGALAVFAASYVVAAFVAARRARKVLPA